jgi:hypothetical protein
VCEDLQKQGITQTEISLAFKKLKPITCTLATFSAEMLKTALLDIIYSNDKTIKQ